jgi:molybdopterin-guanine dinucleotide biosynthesis protein A
MSKTASDAPIVGVLLAGGQARRMGGGDKALLALGGRPLIAHGIARLASQVSRLIINANGPPERFAAFGLPVVADVVGGFAGPLAGILSGLEWARDHVPECRLVVTAPTDAPFLPDDLVARFVTARRAQEAEIVCAVSGRRTHPPIGLWPVALAGALRAAITGEEMRKVDRWTARYRVAQVAWPDGPDGAQDPFFNINRPEDLAEAERRLKCS